MSGNEDETEELPFLCNCGVKSTVDITEKTTLHDVRKLIMIEIDDNLVPPNFVFWVDGTLISKKQEEKKKAFKYINRKLSIKSAKVSYNDEKVRPPPAKYQKNSKGRKMTKDYENEGKNKKSSEPPADSDPNISASKKVDVSLNQPGHAMVMDKQTVNRCNALVTSDTNHNYLDDQFIFNSVSRDDDSVTDHDMNIDLCKVNQSKLDQEILDEDMKKVIKLLNKPEEELSISSESHEDPKSNHEEKMIQDDEASNTSVNNCDYTFENELKVCQDTLKSIDLLLQNNPLFCSKVRMEEWRGEIARLLSKSPPKTIFGVLGNTGVGKSSLLNALLDEASILPTSGSRGCTATVVELRYNIDLLAVEGHEVSVYKGDIEFMSHNEWMTELRILVDECCTQEKRVYQRQPDPQDFPEAAAAWAKIDEVYGKGTMISHEGKPSIEVYKELSNNRRLFQLLSPSDGSAHPYNIISVQEGKVISASNTAEYLLGSYQNMNTRMKRSKKDWAEKFGAEINSYVYRKGNGRDVQTWPLIRKVVLYGPWACLSTGASLVDLPGVRDANVARAKVADNYKQNCNQIWIVAPIKRAVDDGSAKELLGEQFKRRLLMDGQYGNVSFICTQTDDCETTEIMRDHVDVAQNVEGRWEKMVELVGKIRELEKRIEDLIEEEDDLKSQVMYQEQVVDEIEEDNSEQEVGMERMMDAQRNLIITQTKMKDWQDKNSDHIKSMQHECKSFQIKLKTLCAIVRNEYSTKRLKEDFKEGLKALSVTNVEEDDFDDNHDNKAIPDDIDLTVHCVSSNDYLKMQGIKSRSDGLPATFLKAEDTQIPNVRKFTQKESGCFRKKFVHSFVINTFDLLDRVNLIAGNVRGIRNSALSLKCQNAFEKKIKKNADLFQRKRELFSQKIKVEKIQRLQPALVAGSRKGIEMAMSICQSWGSGSKRKKGWSRDFEHNGLSFQTYNATINRQGVYTSPKAGEIDLNQELFDPMEKEFSIEWQRLMNNSLHIHLKDCEKEIKDNFTKINNIIERELGKIGVENIKLKNICKAAARCCSSTIENYFSKIFRVAIETQRKLNRSPLPMIKSQMEGTYQSALGVERGNGTFKRMKDAMFETTELKLQDLFDHPKAALIQGIDALIKKIEDLITKLGKRIGKHLKDVYSILWDNSDIDQDLDPETKEKVKDCRHASLPILNELLGDMAKTQNKLGINLDSEINSAHSSDDILQKKIDEATTSNGVGDIISDSDSDMDSNNEKEKRYIKNPFDGDSDNDNDIDGDNDSDGDNDNDNDGDNDSDMAVNNDNHNEIEKRHCKDTPLQLEASPPESQSADKKKEEFQPKLVTSNGME